MNETHTHSPRTPQCENALGAGTRMRMNDNQPPDMDRARYALLRAVVEYMATADNWSQQPIIAKQVVQRAMDLAAHIERERVRLATESQSRLCG